MATTAQCIFCFETLAASLERRKALSLSEVEELWAKYDDALEQEELGDKTMVAEEQSAGGANGQLRPREISRLQNNESPASASSSSTPSSSSSSSGLNNASQSSSKTSLFSFRKSPTTKEEEHPVYVTWNTISARGNKHLRGCIGTFEPQPISEGLREYSLVSAFQDHRFHPITLRELPSLANSITLLQNFTPCNDPMDWEIGTHGLRIHFSWKGRRHGATYLPHVAPEQGWTKEETLISLMKKAGWTGKDRDWQSVDLHVTKYEGMMAHADYEDYKEWRDWITKEKLV